jgi:hypothetical protein
LPLGEQTVPLPAGSWTVYAVNTSTLRAGASIASVFVAQVIDNRLKAVASIRGTTAPDPGRGGFLPDFKPQHSNYYYRRIFSSIEHGAMDYWFCARSEWVRPGDPLDRAGIGALQQKGIAVPDIMLATVFRIADSSRIVSEAIDFNLVPDESASAPMPDQYRVAWSEQATRPPTEGIGPLEKVRRWGKVWHEALRHAFDGRLQSDEAAAAGLPWDMPGAGSAQ